MDIAGLTVSAFGFRGISIRPGDAAYEEARRIWNGTIEKRPDLILRCGDVRDVVAAVNHARARGGPLTVRGGGHHVAGAALNDGGIVIDLSEMRSVRLDAATQSARAQGGAQLRDVDNVTLPHGRAVPMGVFSDTGIGGLTLSGGYGWQSRVRGLSSDNLLSAQVVTADGQVLEANAEKHPNLFWALRGGGTRLGVVTELQYRTHPMPPTIFQLFTTYPLAQGRAVLQALREYASTAPNEVSLIAVIWTFQESESLPREVWNQPFVGIVGTYIGPAERGGHVLAPLRELGRPLFDGSREVPFGTLQTFFDEDYPKGRRYHSRSTYLKELDDDAIAAFVDLGQRRPSALSSLDLWVLGGALADVGISETPIAHRAAPFMVGIESNWLEASQDATNVAWAREVQARMAPYSTGGSYLNFEDATDPARVAAAYGSNHERLLRIKAQYDPQDLFRLAGRRS